MRRFAFQFAHHDGRQNARIDIAAAEDQADAFAGKAQRLGQHGGQPGRARAFRHGLLQRQVGVDRAFELRLVDQDDVRHQFADDRQRQFADILDRDAFRQSRPADRAIAALERVPHRRIKQGFRAEDFDLRIARFCRDRIAGDQPAAADRDHQNIEVGHLLQHLKRDGALPGDDARRRHKDAPASGRALSGSPRSASAIPSGSRRRAPPRRRASGSRPPSRRASSPA